MNRNSHAGRGKGNPVRDALLLASSTPEARVDHWAGSVPGLVSDSRRRRRYAASPAERITTAGIYWIPRLVPVTALLVLTAIFWSAGSSHTASSGRTQSAASSGTSIDRWLVTGSENGQVSDPLLKALVGGSSEDRRK